jgi:hypothetical protein
MSQDSQPLEVTPAGRRPVHALLGVLARPRRHRGSDEHSSLLALAIVGVGLTMVPEPQLSGRVNGASWRSSGLCVTCSCGSCTSASGNYSGCSLIMIGVGPTLQPRRVSTAGGGRSGFAVCRDERRKRASHASPFRAPT